MPNDPYLSFTPGKAEPPPTISPADAVSHLVSVEQINGFDVSWTMGVVLVQAMRQMDALRRDWGWTNLSTGPSRHDWINLIVGILLMLLVFLWPFRRQMIRWAYRSYHNGRHGSGVRAWMARDRTGGMGMNVPMLDLERGSPASHGSADDFRVSLMGKKGFQKWSVAPLVSQKSGKALMDSVNDCFVEVTLRSTPSPFLVPATKMPCRVTRPTYYNRRQPDVLVC